MITAPIEDPIAYRLVETTSRPAKDGTYKYHAVTTHDTIDMSDLAKANDHALTDYIGHEDPMTALHTAEGVIRAMAFGVMKDGRSRRLGDLLLMRGDITGTFDAPDAPFDPRVNAFVIGLQSLGGLKEFSRKKPPKNEEKRRDRPNVV